MWSVIVALGIAALLSELIGRILYRRLPSSRRRFLDYILYRRTSVHETSDQSESQASPVRYAEHPFLAFTLNPDFLNSHGEKIHNRSGFRDSSSFSDISHNALKVYLAGGSTVYDSAIEHNNETFAVLLETHLSKRLKQPVKVINGGVGNYTSLQSFIRLSSWIDYLRPDLVVTYQGINDITPFLYTDVEPDDIVPDYQHSFKSLHLSDLERRIPLWARHNTFGKYLFCRNLQKRDLNIRFMTMKGSDKVHHIGGNVEFAVSYIRQRINYDMITTHFRNTIAICNARNIKPILITERLESGTDEWYRPFLEEINERIRRFHHAGTCSVIDFAQEFPSKTEYFHGSMHFSMEGNQARAKWIGDALVPHLTTINRGLGDSDVSV